MSDKLILNSNSALLNTYLTIRETDKPKAVLFFRRFIGVADVYSDEWYDTPTDTGYNFIHYSVRYRLDVLGRLRVKKVKCDTLIFNFTKEKFYRRYYNNYNYIFNPLHVADIPNELYSYITMKDSHMGNVIRIYNIHGKNTMLRLDVMYHQEVLNSRQLLKRSYTTFVNPLRRLLGSDRATNVITKYYYKIKNLNDTTTSILQNNAIIITDALESGIKSIDLLQPNLNDVIVNYLKSTKLADDEYVDLYPSQELYDYCKVVEGVTVLDRVSAQVLDEVINVVGVSGLILYKECVYGIKLTSNKHQITGQSSSSFREIKDSFNTAHPQMNNSYSGEFPF